LGAASAITLAGPNTVSAAQANLLAAMGGFGLAAGATLVVGDSASNLLNVGNSAGEVVATQALLTGTSNAVVAAQAAALAGLAGLRSLPGQRCRCLIQQQTSWPVGMPGVSALPPVWR
jgi:hypothetical protein